MFDCQGVRTEGLGRVSRATLLRVASATVTLVIIPMRDNRSVCPISLLASRMNSSSEATNPSSPHTELSEAAFVLDDRLICKGTGQDSHLSGEPERLPALPPL